jgi:hypothetical protein
VPPGQASAHTAVPLAEAMIADQPAHARELAILFDRCASSSRVVDSVLSQIAHNAAPSGGIVDTVPITQPRSRAWIPSPWDSGCRRYAPPAIWLVAVVKPGLRDRSSDRGNHGRAGGSRLKGNADFADWLLALPVGLLVNRSSTRRSSGHTHGPDLQLAPHCQVWKRSLTRKRSLVQIQYRPPASPLVSEAFVRVWRWARLTRRPNCVGLSLAVLPSFVRFRFMLYEQRIHGRGSLLNAGLSSLRYTFSVTFVLPPGTEGANRGRPVRVRRRTGVWSAAPAVAPDVRRGTAGWTGRGIAVPRPARPTRCR